MKYLREWEDVCTYYESSGHGMGYRIEYGMKRMKIHGGWLVKDYRNKTGRVTILYVPDPNHEWELEES